MAFCVLVISCFPPFAVTLRPVFPGIDSKLIITLYWICYDARRMDDSVFKVFKLDNISSFLQFLGCFSKTALLDTNCHV